MYTCAMLTFIQQNTICRRPCCLNLDIAHFFVAPRWILSWIPTNACVLLRSTEALAAHAVVNGLNPKS